MYGEGGKMEDGILQDGEAQLMMGRMIPVLQVSHHNDEFYKYFMVDYVGPCQFYWKNLRSCTTHDAAACSILFS